MTTAEVADLFRVKPRTINAWVKKGIVTPVPVGGRGQRFRRVDLLALLEQS